MHTEVCTVEPCPTVLWGVIMLFVLVTHSNNALNWRLTIINCARTTRQAMNIIYCTFCWTEHAHQVDLLVYLGDPGEFNVQLGHMSPCQKTAQHSIVRLPVISTIKSSSFSPHPKGGSLVCDCVCALFTRATEETFTDKAILTYVSATPTDCLMKDLSLKAAFSPRCRKSCVTLITMCKSWFCAGLRWITVISHAFVVEYPLNQVLHDYF